MFAPFWLMAMSSRSSQSTRLGSIVAIGLCSYFPAFLRAPSRPVFGDALGHYLAVENTLRTGNLFAPNPVVPLAAYYPGLHALAASLVKLSGAPIWDVAVLLLALLHVSTLLGIYSLGFTLSRSSRAAAAAAIIYGLSPQFGFFDSQFAYESLAVPLLVWTVALLLYARGNEDRHVSSTLLVVSVALGLCCVITHHLTSYVLVALLIMIGLSQLAVGERRSARPALGIGLLLGVAAVGWALLTKAPILSYLGYFPRTAFDAIGPIFRQLVGEKAAVTSLAGSGATQTRSLFTGSTLPLYEHYAAFTVQVIAAVASVLAAWRLRHSRSGALVACGLLGGSYFLLLPLRLNLAGEQGAGRVSTFQWIGIAIVVATGLVAEPRRRRVGRHSLGSHRRLARAQWAQRSAATGAAIVLLFVSLVGNYGSAVNAAFRFPGAFELNSSDGRDTPIEAVRLAQWFLSAEGPGQRVVSDVATERVFETYAFTPDLGAFPQWEFFPPGYSSQQLQSLARSGGIDAIVIDDRDAEGGGTSASLPGYPPAIYPPITTASLDRLSSFRWLKLIHKTEHYVVLMVVGEG